MRPADASIPVLTPATYLSFSARLLWSELGVLLPATAGALVIAAPWLVSVVLGAEAVSPLACALFGAPAWTGLLAVPAAAARGESAGFWTMPRAVIRAYRAAVVLGAATAGFAWAFERTLVDAGNHGADAILALAAAGAALGVLLALDLHAFPLLALREAPLRETVRDALALAAAAPGATLALLASGALAFVALRWLGPGTLLLSLPVLAVLHVNNTLLQAERFKHTS